jgi:hypothetical protein
MNHLLDDYLVRAQQQDLLRAACRRHPERCAAARHPRHRRSWRRAGTA